MNGGIRKTAISEYRSIWTDSASIAQTLRALPALLPQRLGRFAFAAVGIVWTDTFQLTLLFERYNQQ